jgi:hypothetical protein
MGYINVPKSIAVKINNLLQYLCIKSTPIEANKKEIRIK